MQNTIQLALVVLLCKIRCLFGCTSLVVGREASVDGSVMVTHSNDFELNPDARLCWIPAKDHPPGSRRPVYGNKEDYKRYVGVDRGDCYFPDNGEPMTQPIGYIPQVNHTYAYHEAQYGLVNEHGVGMGESTCSSAFGANDTSHGGHAMLNVDTLTRIAMERSRTARQAIELMGALAEQYGFFGADSFEGTAESLMVGDAIEAFIFHVMPDPTGASAIWVAQRVPDDHVGVVANMFVIREIRFDDPHNFLFSQSVREVAKAKGWWKDADGLLDFTKVYSDGEYAHKFYSGRRVWGSYRLFGIHVPDTYSDLRYDALYPVTAKPAKKVAVHDLFKIHRDYYQGTKYDMTRGLAAGPWGDPDRFDGSTSVKGNWERSIGIYRTSTTHVAQLRNYGQGAILWFAPHASATSVFIPIAGKGTVIPTPYTVASPSTFDSSAYSTHRMVFNLAKIKYNYAMVDIRQEQSMLEEAGFELVKQLDAAVDLNASVLNQAYADHAQRVIKAFTALPMKLLGKFADGNLNGAATLGYPEWWLKAVGYEQGPPPVPEKEHTQVQAPSYGLTVSILSGCLLIGLSILALELHIWKHSEGQNMDSKRVPFVQKTEDSKRIKHMPCMEHDDEAQGA